MSWITWQPVSATSACSSASSAFTCPSSAAGERSYTPRQYRAFFAAATRLTRFEINPFLFPFPGGVPPVLLRTLIAFNRAIEKTPFFRWQCSNVWMQIEFTK